MSYGTPNFTAKASTMTNHIPKLNPLNIDFGQIIAAGERRRDILGQINDTIHTKVDAALTGCTDAENFFNELNRLWKALDPEGRELLPDSVADVMKLSSHCQSNLKNVVGSKNDGDAGLINIAQYGMGAESAEEAPVNSILSNFATQTPTEGVVLVPSDSEGLRIGFVAGWNWGIWPTGCWVCCLDRESTTHAGTGPNPTSAYNNWVAKRQGRGLTE